MEPYPYEVNDHHQLKLDLLLEKINQVAEPDKAVLILHTSAHNPTGVDPTREQWREIKKVCYERGILPVFDCAYQVIIQVLFSVKLKTYKITLNCKP